MGRKNDESQGIYDDNQIRFKTSMLRPSLCDYNDAHILERSLAVANVWGAGAAGNNDDKKDIFKNCVPLIICISRIYNTQVDDAHDIDVVMPMYNLIGHSDNYSKTSETLWQYCRDEPVVDNNGYIVDFNEANATANFFNLKAIIAGQTSNNDIRKNVEIMVPLKWLSNFWRTLEYF